MSERKIISVSIIGEANAGKSTLLNQMIGQKISIVTHKKQTTRSPITGVLTKEETQIIFYDTPGIFYKKKISDKMIIKPSWHYINSSDLILLVLDVRKSFSETMYSLIDKLISKKNTIFILNKIDIIERLPLEKTVQFLDNLYPKIKKFLTSAKQNLGIESIISFLKSSAKEGHWLFEKEQITNLSNHFLASEITRESLLLNLKQEVPYNLVVQTDSFKSRKNSIDIYQSILVQTESHKKIILGTRGKKIKKIGIESRIKISALFRSKINLYLHIKLAKLEKYLSKNY